MGKRAGGFLFNKKNPFPKGKLFLDPDDYIQALEGDEGWNTGPADAGKAKQKAEKEKADEAPKIPTLPKDDEKTETEENPLPKEEEGKLGPEEKEKEEKPKPKPKRKRRKK